MSDVGEIVGRLRIDEGNWYRELDRAEAKANSLGRSNPRVTVTADTRGAVRELESTERAADRAGRDRSITLHAETAKARAQLDAASRSAERVSLAEQRMKAAIEQAARASAEAAALQKRLEVSQKDAAASALRASAAEESLRGAREQSAAASARAAVTEELLERARAGSAVSSAAVVSAESAIVEQHDATSRSSDKVVQAEQRLRAARQASERADAVARLAQMRLAEVRSKGSSTALQVASAEEAARHAIEKAALAAEKAVLAERALANAHQAAAAAALEHAAAEETVEGAIDRTARRADSGAGRIALWTSAIIAALPPLIPIAGAAVAGAGALGLLGGAGILAGTGIMRGAKTGQGAFALYRPLINDVVDDVHKLQDVAAAGLLPGAERTLAVLEQKMPGINRGVDEFGRRLGAIAPEGLSAVVGLVEKGAPLWRAGSDWIARMVQGLDDFAQSSAYEGFIDYSVANLPKVGRFLASVVDLAGDILVAWAPLGAATLPVLTEIVTEVGGIVQATGPLIPAIGGVYFAFRAWTGIRGIIDGINTGLLLMTGRAAAAGRAATVAEGAGGLLGGIGGRGKGAAKVGAGKGLKGIVGGVLGGGGLGGPIGALALATVASIAAYSDQPGPKNPVTTPGSWNAGQGPKQSWGASAPRPMGGMSASGSWSGFAPAAKGAADANERVAVSNTNVAATARTAASASRAYARTLAQQILNGNNTAAAQNALSATTLGLESAQLGARDAITAAAKSMKDNGTSIAGNTEKARANKEAIVGAVSGITAYGSSLIKSGKSATDARIAQDKMAIGLENSLVKMGANRAEVSRYIAKLLGIPKNRSTKLDLQEAQAVAKAERAKRYADLFAKGDYKAILKGDFTRAQKASARAKAFGGLYAKGDYKGILRGDYTPAQKAAATAAQKAKAFANAAYIASLRARDETAAAVQSAQARINSLRDRTVRLAVNYVVTGRENVGGGAKFGATGGTVGSASIGSMRALRGMAGGGTIHGAGSAATDTAGLFRLAAREEVTSNLYGQADKNRVMLKAINSGDDSKIRRTAQEQYGAGQQPVQVHIAPKLPGLTVEEMVEVKVTSAIQAQNKADERARRMGWQSRGGRA